MDLRSRMTRSSNLLVRHRYSWPSPVTHALITCSNILSAEGLPFGGIGPSGCRSITKMVVLSSRLMIHVPLAAGCSTGKFSFDMFTHLRATLDNPGLFVIFHWHVD